MSRLPGLPQWIFWCAASVVFAATSVVVATTNRFGYSSICEVCGKEMLGTRWFLPGTEKVVHESTYISDTPLSLTLAGDVPPHEHDWQFCQGGGRGMCALGNAHGIWATVYCEPVVRFLGEAHRWGERPFNEQLRRMALRQQSTQLVTKLAFMMPKDGFKDKEDFRSWLADNHDTVSEMNAIDAKSK